METFTAEEGRFQYLGQKKGINFYNDNNATNPISTEFSLKALSEKYKNSNIYLIAGGSDKDFKFLFLSKSIQKYCKDTVLFSGTGTEKIIPLFKKSFKNYQIVSSMKEAFLKLVEKAKKNDVIILSPGAASFGIFKNEYDRNDQFLKEFKKFK